MSVPSSFIGPALAELPEPQPPVRHSYWAGVHNHLSADGSWHRITKPAHITVHPSHWAKGNKRAAATHNVELAVRDKTVYARRTDPVLETATPPEAQR